MHSTQTKQLLAEKATGKTHSNETRQLMRTNNWSKTDPDSQRQHASKIAKDRARSGKTETEKQQISSAIAQAWADGKYASRKPNRAPKNSGKIWINDGTKSKMISKDQPIPDGWSNGRIKQS